jgi:8-oxo-dGTP diphosphatase
MVEKALLWLWQTMPIPNWLRWFFQWLVNPKFLIGVAAVILDEQGRILLFKHTYRGRHPWGLPSGWLKRNENPAQAVEREVYEESRLKICTLHPLAALHSRSARVDLIYIAEAAGGKFHPSAEVSQARYFSLDELTGVLGEQNPLVEIIRNAVSSPAVIGGRAIQ